MTRDPNPSIAEIAGGGTIDFRDPAFLKRHIRSLMDFYAPTIVDETGGFFQNFRDDGSVFDPGFRHLVSSGRMVFNFCKAGEILGDPVYRERAAHGLEYLRDVHWQPERQGYAWTLRDHEPEDETNHCYGLAFMVLTFATALKAGFGDARADLERTFDLMEMHLWQAESGLYADEASPDWSAVAAYRGQNANMHACEGVLAAFEATGEERYLERAYQLARTVTVELAGKAGGQIWEHYTSNLDIDWEYNKDDPRNLYRPWGFQPGHQTEWAKLLLVLHRRRPEPWMIERAKSLFDNALDVCWDDTHGGIFYGYAPDGSICDDDKYFWVIAESFAAAALLAEATDDASYWDWYDRIWSYAWLHMIDHIHGAWYRVLTRDNRPYSDEKSTAGGKCDYHPLAACLEVYNLLQRRKAFQDD